MTTREPDDPFVTGGLKPRQYKLSYKKQFPNCTCTYDDYDCHMVRHTDCPDHGEFCQNCTKDGKPLLMRNCPMHRLNSTSRGVVNIGDGRPKPTVEQTRDMLLARPYDPPPAHYDGGNGLDNWAIWDAYDLDRYTANAVKYILRAGKKSIAPKLDDLRKARNYINKAIEMEEKREADQGS